jgi:hypothetical protein
MTSQANQAKQILKDLKEQGQKLVKLEGWVESVDYVLSLSIPLKFVEEVKHGDGYSYIKCFEFQ